MSIFKNVFALVVTLALSTRASAQVPGIINYQGRVVVGGTNFTGSGRFRFALVDGTGTTTYWSNGAATVSVPVTKGLYAVLLGDTSIPNMSLSIPATVFSNADVRLRVWFSDGVSGLQQLTPDQRIAAIGYALMAANVPDGAITSAKLAPGAVGSAQLAVNLTASGSFTGTFAGNGAGLTNVNVGQLANGDGTSLIVTNGAAVVAQPLRGTNAQAVFVSWCSPMAPEANFPVLIWSPPDNQWLSADDYYVIYIDQLWPGTNNLALADANFPDVYWCTALNVTNFPATFYAADLDTGCPLDDIPVYVFSSYAFPYALAKEVDVPTLATSAIDANGLDLSGPNGWIRFPFDGFLEDDFVSHGATDHVARMAFNLTPLNDVRDQNLSHWALSLEAGWPTSTNPAGLVDVELNLEMGPPRPFGGFDSWTRRPLDVSVITNNGYSAIGLSADVFTLNDATGTTNWFVKTDGTMYFCAPVPADFLNNSGVLNHPLTRWMTNNVPVTTVDATGCLAGPGSGLTWNGTGAVWCTQYVVTNANGAGRTLTYLGMP